MPLKIHPVLFVCYFCGKRQENMAMYRIEIVQGSAGVLRYVCDGCAKDPEKCHQ